jgi:hypothetical protein
VGFEPAITHGAMQGPNYSGNTPFAETKGGDGPGNPDGTSVFPQRIYVDYIAVYQ